jgi:small Trp-rich protein
MSWWWVLLPLGLAIIWFEWLERLFGRDRRKAEAAAWADHRKERIASQFRKGQGRQ